MSHALYCCRYRYRYTFFDDSVYDYCCVNIFISACVCVCVYIDLLSWIGGKICCLSEVMQVGFELIAWIEMRISTYFEFGLLYWDG